MFNFFRKNNNKDNDKVESIEDVNIDEPTKKIAFNRSVDQLLKNPSFSILIQLNKETEEFVVATDIESFDDENADLIGAVLSILTNGDANKIIIDALNNFSNDEKEEIFIENILKRWKAYNGLALESKVEPKSKIDPTKIFNIRGGNTYE